VVAREERDAALLQAQRAHEEALASEVHASSKLAQADAARGEAEAELGRRVAEAEKGRIDLQERVGVLERLLVEAQKKLEDADSVVASQQARILF